MVGWLCVMVILYFHDGSWVETCNIFSNAMVGWLGVIVILYFYDGWRVYIYISLNVMVGMVGGVMVIFPVSL